MSDAAIGSPFDARAGGDRSAVEQPRAEGSVDIGGAHGAQDNLEPPRASLHAVRERTQVSDGERRRALLEAELQTAPEQLCAADAETLSNDRWAEGGPRPEHLVAELARPIDAACDAGSRVQEADAERFALTNANEPTTANEPTNANEPTANEPTNAPPAAVRRPAAAVDDLVPPDVDPSSTGGDGLWHNNDVAVDGEAVEEPSMYGNGPVKPAVAEPNGNSTNDVVVEPTNSNADDAHERDHAPVVRPTVSDAVRALVSLFVVTSDAKCSWWPFADADAENDPTADDLVWDTITMKPKP